MKKSAMISLFLTLALIASSCSLPVNDTGYEYPSIEELIKSQQDFVNNRDENGFLTTINRDNTVYWNESKYFAHNLTFANFSDFKMEIESMGESSEDEVIVTIRQSYLQNGNTNSTTYDNVYVRRDGTWYDNDLHFESVKLGGIKVLYMAGVSNLETLKEKVLISVENVEATFPEKVEGDFEIKLYSDQELLRQKTDLGIEWLFTGWAEEGHAIKAYTEHKNDYNYEVLFTHELIHKVTIARANGNMPIWFAEGLATHYGSNFVSKGDYIDQGKSTAQDLNTSLEELIAQNLQVLQSKQEIYAYYGTAAMYVKYLAETYGDEKVFELYQTLGMYPFNDIASNPNWTKVCDDHMKETLKKVLGLEIEEISNGYLLWYEERYL
ncbi:MULTISPECIES: hypothetical protein [unclassified Fusibacter]|uniref:hypothetical protein n=1 Tax=unclassified Fusibacter TaxID=2624464 RepID=UPI00101207A1|nr:MULTISPECIES: hypothetical protein [unclassified Fusibacter]MCK8060752.1 hypothetical protein [Fusibacter sp. A2]NPE23048.1 hypothetical protein [Fusibacter sp. A1]RXV59720.1 hypothetical protein DWB64_14495 [Fusibacter sp. A1]